MKLPILALCLVLGSGAYAQELSTREVNAISVEMKRINAQTAKARRSVADVMDESSEGGQVTIFRRGKSLLKLNSKFYGEMNQWHSETWFQGGQPLFVLERKMYYDGPLSVDVKIANTEESRFYFRQGRLAAFKFGNRWQKLTPKTRLDKEKEIRDSIARYSKLAK